MSRLLTLTGVALAVVSCCGLASASSQSLFPLRDGAIWKLENASGHAITIKTSRLSSGAGFEVRGLPGLGPVRVRSNGGNVDLWNARSSRWEQFLRLTAPVATRYRVDVAGSTLWRAVLVTVASRSAVCHDARGNAVRGCVRLTLRSLKPVADAGVEELVFAPGIGLAEVVVQTIAGPVRYALGGAGPTLS